MKTKPIPGLTPEEIERFWSKVDQSGGPDACWEWQGAHYSNGYGCYSLPSGQYGASRIAYRIEHDQDPGELFVLHICDNGHLGCVNPQHLFLGTQKDNGHDCHLKGRTAKGEGHGRHKLCRTQVEAIRASSDTCKSLGARFNVSPAEICLIKNNKKWNTDEGHPSDRLLPHVSTQHSSGA
jgi:hypothetical protein